jgi:hypothetical protein
MLFEIRLKLSVKKEFHDNNQRERISNSEVVICVIQRRIPQSLPVRMKPGVQLGKKHKSLYNEH